MPNSLDPNHVYHYVEDDLGSNFAKVISRINYRMLPSQGSSNKEGYIF